MRLWHYKLIPYLDRQRLIAQYRECCAIIKNIADNGTPNHILVNKVLEYPSIHFEAYTHMIIAEMKKRGYNIGVNSNSYRKFCERLRISRFYFRDDHNCYHVENNEVFPYWHNDRYLKQCLFNLEEKALCYGISKDEWNIIYNKFSEDYDLCQIK